jgi:hypothetical protein
MKRFVQLLNALTDFVETRYNTLLLRYTRITICTCSLVFFLFLGLG